MRCDTQAAFPTALTNTCRLAMDLTGHLHNPPEALRVLLGIEKSPSRLRHQLRFVTREISRGRVLLHRSITNRGRVAIISGVRRLVCLVAFVAVALPGSAGAHAEPLRTIPADRAVLSKAPSRVLVLFDDPVRVGPGNEALRNGGASILSAEPRARGKVLELPLRRNLRNGDYSVRWSIVSDDGHVEEGVLAFGVGSGPPPTPTLRTTTRVGLVTVLTRWLFFAGLLIAGGLALFDLAVWRPVARSLLPTGWIAIGLGAVLVSANALVYQSHAGISTRFGSVFLISAGVAAVGAAAAALADKDPAVGRFAQVLAIALLLAPTLTGHSLDAGRSWVDVPIDFLHVLAVAFWLGSLVALALVVPRQNVTHEVRGAAVRRFSRLALIAVLVLAATGVGQALAELASVSQLWSTGYGRAIVVKTALFGLLIVLVWVSRSRIGAGYAKLRVSLAAELVVLLALLVAVGVLTALPPGRNVRAREAAATPATPAAAKLGVALLPPSDATVLGQRDDRLAAAIAVRPSGKAIATFIGTDAKAADVGRVVIDGRSTRTCGVGCYAGTAGPGRIVTVSHRGKTLRFDLGLRRPAAELLKHETRAYRRLRSTVYRQRIESGLGTSVVALWTEVAPDSFSYRIEKGGEAIVIGTRRWDRDPGQTWKASTAVISNGPTPLWDGGHPIANAHILRQGAKSDVVSFLDADRSFPAWFTVVIERRTLHLLSVQMTAAAHFMRARYLSWNEPIVLQPPR
jgi:copper transport protein